MVLSRRVWVGLIAALPAVLVSLRFVDVVLHPAAGNNSEWAEDAQFLVKLEFLMIFVTVVTAWIAGHATVLGRVFSMIVLAAVFGTIGYGLWLYTEGSRVILGAGLLIAGRFLAGAIAGPEAEPEFTERAGVGVVFYLAILFAVFGLPEAMPNRYAFHLAHPAAAFCALYFLLHALMDAVQIYVATPEAASRRLSVRLGTTHAFTQSSLALRFAGDAFELVRFEHARAAGRIVAFFFGAATLGLAAIFMVASRGEAFLFAFVPFVVGSTIVAHSLRPGARTSILQARRGGLAKLEIFNGKLDSVVDVVAADISIDIRPLEKGSGVMLHFNRIRDDTWWLMLSDSRLRGEAAARSLQHLFELYISGDPSPKGLRKALEEDPGLAALLGPEVIERLLAAPPMQVREGTMNCPACKTEIAASAPRCGFCGLLYPAQD